MCASARRPGRRRTPLEPDHARRHREREPVAPLMRSSFNPIFASLETTIFETMSRLARETSAVNLGQGFPDDPGPEDVGARRPRR